MATDGVLLPHKKTFMVPGAERSRYGARMIWITGAEALGESGIFEFNSRRVLDAMEHECAQLNMRFEIVRMDYVQKEIGPQLGMIPTHDEPVVGYVINLWWIELMRRDRLDAVIRRISSTGLRVVIFDQVGEYTLSDEFKGVPTIQILRCAARSAGRDLANLFLRNGHTSVAFLSFQHNYLWSRVRLEGVLEAYHKAGLRRNVYPILDTESGGYFESLFAFCGHNRDKFRRIVKGHPTEHLFLAAIDSNHPVTLQELSRKLGQNKIDEISGQFANLLSLLELVPAPLFAGARDALFASTLSRMGELQIGILLEKAFAKMDATGWIAATDSIGLSALKFLREKKLRVPQDVSVSGFDNLPESLGKGLTTLDFNLPQIARAILGFLLASGAHKKKKQAGPVEVPGLIIRRESVGRA
jgi:DNA-binding LacI/PurR family transcriptional regulator